MSCYISCSQRDFLQQVCHTRTHLKTMSGSRLDMPSRKLEHEVLNLSLKKCWPKISKKKMCSQKKKSTQAELGTMNITQVRTRPQPGTGTIASRTASTKRASGCTPPTESQFILDSLPLFNLKYSSLKKQKARGTSSFNLAWRSHAAASWKHCRGKKGRGSCLSALLRTHHPFLLSTQLISKLLGNGALCLWEKGSS